MVKARRGRRWVVTATACLATAGAAACAGILGIDPVRLESSEAGTQDGTADGPGGGDAGDPGDVGDARPLFDGALEASMFDAPLSDAACVPCRDAAVDPCGVVCDAPAATEFLEVGNGFVFFGSQTKLERVDLNGANRKTIASGGPIGGFAFHPSGWIAWSLPLTNEINIQDSNGAGAVKTFVVPANGQMHAKFVLLTDAYVVYFEGGDGLYGGGKGVGCLLTAFDCSAPITVFGGSASEEVVAVAQSRDSNGASSQIGWRTRGVTLDAGSVYSSASNNLFDFSKLNTNAVSTMPFMPFAVAGSGNGVFTRIGDGGFTDIFLGSVSNEAPVERGHLEVASIAIHGGGVMYVTEPGAKPEQYAGQILKLGLPDAHYENRPNPARIVQDPFAGLFWIDRGNPPQTPSLIMRGKL
jgi:hypothetical protein